MGQINHKWGENLKKGSTYWIFIQNTHTHMHSAQVNLYNLSNALLQQQIMTGRVDHLAT